MVVRKTDTSPRRAGGAKPKLIGGKLLLALGPRQCTSALCHNRKKNYREAARRLHSDLFGSGRPDRDGKKETTKPSVVMYVTRSCREFPTTGFRASHMSIGLPLTHLPIDSQATSETITGNSRKTRAHEGRGQAFTPHRTAT